MIKRWPKIIGDTQSADIGTGWDISGDDFGAQLGSPGDLSASTSLVTNGETDLSKAATLFRRLGICDFLEE